MISGVSKVVLPVDDQERAKEFWTSRMGFELRRDESYGDERWIEVSPPDGAPLLVLSPRTPDEPRRDVPDQLPHSPVFFNCPDIEATYHELSRRGVEFPVAAAAAALRLVVAVRGPGRHPLRARSVATEPGGAVR